MVHGIVESDGMQTIFDEKAFSIIPRTQYYVILSPVFRENQPKFPFLCRQAPSNRGQSLTDGSKHNVSHRKSFNYRQS